VCFANIYTFYSLLHIILLFTQKNKKKLNENIGKGKISFYSCFDLFAIAQVSLPRPAILPCPKSFIHANYLS
jgi:hypothetical protein